MLSILIPSIPERSANLNMLLDNIFIQNELAKKIDCFEYMGGIEMCIDDSKSFLNGGLSIGKKREGLVKKATGKYLCFLDDDENISPNYVETLLRMCNEDKDVCTFRSIFKLKDYWGLVDMKMVYKVNDQASPDYTIRRPPWHICPVRSEFAKLYPFEDINNAEDFKWFEKVLSHCTSEAHTDRILFQYNHNINSEADKIENNK